MHVLVEKIICTSVAASRLAVKSVKSQIWKLELKPAGATGSEPTWHHFFIPT